MKTTKTWILVADAGRARILERSGQRDVLSEVPGARIEVHVPSSREIEADRPGRTMVSGGAVRHAFTPHSDSHREAKRQFLQRLAERLDDDLTAGSFDSLILIAPPQALGDLRAALSKAVAGRVVGELDKDLTKVPDHEIPGHLANASL